MPVKVLVVCPPCDNFGDVVFAMKIGKYLNDWYGKLVHVHYAGDSDKFGQLGVPKSQVTDLEGEYECVNLGRFKPARPLRGYDVYLIAPLTMGNTPSYRSARALLPDSTRDNTFFMSEYNMPKDSDIAFQTGVGAGRLGLLFFGDEPHRGHRRPPALPNPYVLMYMNKDDPDVRPCYRSFLAMVTAEYGSKRKLDVVMPAWAVDHVRDDLDAVADVLDDRFSTLRLVTKGGPPQVVHMDPASASHVLTLRFDVLPVPFARMAPLYRHALPHALLTGDQSITDFLDVRGGKRASYPYYQTMEWKRGLAQQVAAEMPQRFWKSARTSCGGLQAVGYRPDVHGFIRDNDFRRLGRPLMDAIIAQAQAEPVSRSRTRSRRPRRRPRRSTRRAR
jgi:hypothetical protein